MQAHQRHVRYFVMMSTCVGLFVLAWGVVRFYSVGAAIGMCVVAMIIPPVAAILANSRDRDDDWWNDPRWDDPDWKDPGHDRDRPDHEQRPPGR
ncbi:DUF3099 domain-containing protein [Streptacidiphilus albus]|uniref:DUF3099 domain-containing protein n=1 Tax=Streptacidiphilus albus TaxID=105425 RepID=UPI00054B8D74|nr:DUF3099 domain-containing protein [Streptacidiphilus albus]